MPLTITMITDLLGERPGRYINGDMGYYRMKEANGDDVKITDNGRECLVEPVAIQMDNLMDAGRLRQNGSRYYLA